MKAATYSEIINQLILKAMFTGPQMKKEWIETLVVAIFQKRNRKKCKRY